MPKKVTANGKTFTFDDNVTEEQIGEAIDSYFSEESNSTIEKKKLTPTPIQPQSPSLLSTATSGTFGNTQSPKQNTLTEQSNGQSPQRGINLLRGKSVKPIDVQGEIKRNSRDDKDVVSYASNKLADIYARGDESEKEKLVPIIEGELNNARDKGRSVRKEYNDVYDFYENKKIDEDFIKNATQNDIIQNVNSKSEALKNFPQELAIYQTTKEAKIGKLINDIQVGEKIGDRDVEYLKQNAPMAYKQMLKDVEQFSTDFPIQNINTVAEINKKRNDATAQIKGGESLKQSVQAFANVIPEDMLGMGVINSKLQGIKDSYASELKKLEEQYPIETENVKVAGEFDTRIKPRPQEYIEAKQELEQKRDELLGMAGRMEAIYYGKKNPNVDATELGKKFLEVQSPTMYSLYRNAGNSKNFEADLTKMGIDIMLSSGDPSLIAKGKEGERTFNDKYPEWKERDLLRRLAVEHYKGEGVSTIANKGRLPIERADNLMEQFSDKDRDFYLKYVRPKYNNIKNVPTISLGGGIPNQDMRGIPIPNAGGMLNSFLGGLISPMKGTANLLGNALESDQQKAQRALSPQRITEEELFNKDRINTEIDGLLKKDKLNIIEAKKLSDLYTQQSLKGDAQRLVDGSFNLLGQVTAQGMIGGMLGSGTSALLSSSSSGLKGLGYLAQAEKVAEMAGNMSAMSNFGNSTFAFLSSYDDASLEMERLAPNASSLFKMAYATSVGVLNGATERIFKDEKIFDAFKREVAPEIASLVANLSTGSITEEVFRQQASTILKNRIPKYLGNVVKENIKEDIEEATTEAGGLITKLAGVALGQIDPSQVNVEEGIEAVGQVFKQTAIDGLLVSALAGRGESLRSRTTQRALYELATNQQQLDGFIDAVNLQQQSGKMSVEDATDKIKTARTLNEVATQTIPALEKRITLDDNQKVALTSLLTLEKKLENDLANPKNSGIKSVIESQLADVRNKKDGILKGEYIVDENFNALTPDELKQKVAEEKQQEEELKKSISKVNTNPSFVIIEETDGTFSVLIDNEKKEEGFKTKEEASQRVLKLNGIQFEDAPKSTRKVTEKDGITIEMPYNKITEEGGVTYEEPSTTTPNKVVEKDGISIELPASQEDLQTTQNTPQNEETIEATNTEVATNIGQQPSNAPIQEEDTKDATQSEISIHQSVQGVMNGMPITIQRKDDGDYIYTILGAKTPFTKEQHDELVESREVVVTKGKETKLEQKPISPSGENGNVEQTPTQKENGGEVTATTNIPISTKGDSKGEAKEGTRDKVQPSTETISTTTTDEYTSVLESDNPALRDVESTAKAEIEKIQEEIDSYDEEYNGLVDLVNKEDRKLNTPKSENEIKLNQLQNKIQKLRDRRDKLKSESLLSKEQTPKTDINDFQYVIDKANKAEGGVKGSGTKKINLSDRETAILNKTIEKLEAKAVANNGASFDPNETINIQYEKINGKEQKINTYTVDGYSIKYKYNSGKSMTEITTPQGDLLIVSKQYGKTEIAYLGKSESLLSKEQPKAETPIAEVKVKSFKQGDGGTKGVFEGEDGKLYKSIEPQEAVQDKDGNFKRQTIKDKLTDEHEILSDLQDNPHIPKVGKIVNTTEGKAFEIEKLDEVDTFTKDEYREIQKILNALNDKGYHVGDKVTVMRRPKTGELVIVDFSAGYKGSRMSRDADEYMQNVKSRLSDSDKVSIEQEDKAENDRFTAEALSSDESTTEYYLTRRPPSIGTHPIEGLNSIEESILRGRKVWKLNYDRKLSAKEIENFELTPKMTNKEFLGQKVKGIFGKGAFYISNIDYDKGDITFVSELKGKEISINKTFREFQKGLDEGRYEIEQPKAETPKQNIKQNEKQQQPKTKGTDVTKQQTPNTETSGDNQEGSGEVAKKQDRRGKTPKSKRKIKNPTLLSALKVDTAGNPYWHVLQYFINKGTYSAELLTEIYGKSKRGGNDLSGQKTILPEGEKRARIEFLNKKSFKTVDSLAEKLSEDYLSSNNILEGDDTNDSRAFRELLEDAINSFGSRMEMADFILEQVNQEYDSYIGEYDDIQKEYGGFADEAIDYLSNLSDEQLLEIDKDMDAFFEANPIEMDTELDIESQGKDTPKLSAGKTPTKTITKKAFDKLLKTLKKAFPNVDVFFDEKTLKSKLLENGVDFTKFLSMFDENRMNNESGIQFMQTPNRVIYGAKFPDGSVYLNPDVMSAETPLHEMSHVWESYLPKQWKEGLEIFKDTIGFKKALKEIQDNPAYSNKTPEEQASEALNTLIGRKGEGYYNSGVMLSKFKAWMDKFFKTLGDKIGKALGIKNLQLTPDQKLDIFVNDILGDLLGGEEVVQQNDTQEKGVKFSEEYESSPSFKKWKGGNRLVSESAIQDVKTGEPIVAKVYHGTTNEFYEFDSSVKGSIEGHLGKVNYFTSEYDDASENYLSQGSDIKSRVENLKDRVLSDLENEIDDSFEGEAKDEKIRDIISEKYPDFDSSSLDFNMELFEVADRVSSSLLIGGEEKVLDLYVKLNNPIVLGNGSTWFDALEIDETYLEEATQEVADEYGISEQEAKDEYDYEIRDRAIEKQGEGNKVVEALEKALDDNGYDSSLASEILGDNYYETEVDLDSIEKSLRKAELYENYNGEIASSQVIADLFKNLGFDGIILTDVSDRFKNMGLNESTSHIHVFDEFKNQIKLADGTNTTFNPDTNDIRFMSIGSNVSKSISKLSELSSKIDNAQTTSEARKAKEDYDNELKKDSKLNFIITNFTSITDQLNKLKLITKKGDC
jgi:hypothetical protein